MSIHDYDDVFILIYPILTIEKYLTRYLFYLYLITLLIILPAQERIIIINFQRKMLLESTTKNCVLCGQKITQPFVALSDNTFIHSQCLIIAETSWTNPSFDEDLKLFYQYILNLKIVCSKCKNLIDGTTLKKWGNSVENKPICTVCSLGKIQKQLKVQTCDLCSSEINLSNTIKTEMKIEGISICKVCFEGQNNAVNKVQLQEKPDFKMIKNLKNPFLNNLKFQRSQEKCLYNNLFEQRYINRKNYVKHQNEKKLKNDKIKCCICFQRLKLNEFSFRDETENICKKCYKNCNSDKKIEEFYVPNTEESGSFGIDMLFFEDFQTGIQKNLIPKNVKVEEKKIICSQQVNQEHKYSEKECKICFNGQSKMMNIECRHLMMCEKCYKKMELRNNRKDKLPCPVCQTLGKYMKYIEPIYI